MKITITLYIYTVCLLLSGCSSPAKIENYNFQTLSQENIVEKDIAQLDSLIESYEFIPLETTEQSLISSVNGVQYYNDRFFITASVAGLPSEIFVFNKQGQFLHKVGSIGRGPGEYIALSSWFINPMNDQITLIDPAKQKIIFYNLDGQYLSDIDADTSLSHIKQLYWIDSTTVLGNYAINPNKRALIATFSPELKLQKQLRSTLYSWYGRYAYSSNPFGSGQNECLVVQPLNDTILNYKNNHLEPAYVITYRNEGKVLKLKKSETDVEKNMDKAAENKLRFINGLVENDRYILFRYNDGSIVWNKDSKTGQFIADGFRADELNGYPLIPHATCFGGDDFFISLDHAESFRNTAEVLCENKGRQHEELQKILTSLQEGDNPIVVMYHLKSR